MIKSYFKVFLRKIKWNWKFTVINILGLAIGLCCFLIITLFTKHEFDYDKHVKDYKNTYRIVKYFEEENIEFGSYTPPPLASIIKQELPSISNVMRYRYWGEMLCENGESIFYETIHSADSSFFDVFDYQFSVKELNLLKQPFCVVITESISKKYFKKANSIGEYITIDNKPYKITGIIKSTPKNAHLKFDFLISFASFEVLKGNDWMINSWRVNCLSTYIVIHNNQKKEHVQSGIQKLLDKYTGNFYDLKLKVILQPLNDIHLKSNFITYDANNRNKGNINTIRIFLLIGTLILIISCINYTNFNIIQSFSQSKEIGLRKVFGANKINVRKQFIGESIIITLIAYVVSLTLIKALLPLFNSYLNRQLSLSEFASLDFLVFSLVIVILIGFLSAIYQSAILSKLNPLAIFNRKNCQSPGNLTVKKLLIVAQLSISIFMILFSIFIYKQVNYITNKDLGYSKENVIAINLHSTETRSKINLLQNKFELNPSIKASSASMYGNKYHNNGYFKEYGTDKKINLYYNSVDNHFFNTLNIEIIKGQNLSEYNPSDSTLGVILNETAAKAFGWENPIGKRIDQYYKVVGVIKDYNFLPLSDEHAPMLYFYLPNYFEKLLIKINPINKEETINYIKSQWEEIIPNQPIDYYFLDSHLLDDYKEEITSKRLFTLFTLISVFITIVGLIVITAYSISMKMKQIVIKKVLGATNTQIIHFVFKDYISLLILSNLIAWPITFFFIRNWLNNFAYRINLDLRVFLLTGLILSIIIALAILFQVVKVAKLNPTEVLKYE